MTMAVPKVPPARRTLVAVSVMLATIMQTLDMTIANVALPHMQGSMSATPDQISWVLTSYIVAAAIMTPPTGVLAARFGRKRVLAVMVIGFTISSMLCGAATSLTEIVIFRLLQGAFGAGLVPLSQAVLLDTYPREKYGPAMAMWGMGVMVGPILGPVLGGYLTEASNWRWVFYINLPFGILALLGIFAFVPETARDLRRGFDAFGFALLSFAIGGLQLMLDRGQSQDWFSSAEITIEAVLSGLFLYMFIVHMCTAKRPFIEPQLFKDRNFVVGLFFIFMIGVVLLATAALLPPFLQQLMGFPVLTTGFVLAPRGIGTMISMLMVGRLVGKVDARLLIMLGVGLTALSLGEMSGFTTDVSISTIVRTGVTQGLGLGFIFVPLSTLTFSTLAPHFRNEGTTMFSLLRNLGSSIGVSIVFTLLAHGTQVNHAGIAQAMTPFREALQSPALLQTWNWHTPSGLAALNGEVTRQAATIAYLNDFTFMMWMALLSLLLLPLLRTRRQAAAAGPVAAD